MSIPLNPRAFTPIPGVTAQFAPATAAPAIITDRAQVQAFVLGSEVQMQSLLARVLDRSQGRYGGDIGNVAQEVYYPDHRNPCPCGPEADNSDAAKAWDGDPNWCMKGSGSQTAPVLRQEITCAQLPLQFWIDLWTEAQLLLRGYLAHPPQNYENADIQALWTQRVFDLCTIMGTSSNISPAIFNAFAYNPVDGTYNPRVKLLVRDAVIPLAYGGGNTAAYVTEVAPGQQVTDANAALALTPYPLEPQAGGQFPFAPVENPAYLRQTGILPALPAALRAMWTPPAGQQQSEIPGFNLGMLDALKPAYMKFRALDDLGGVLPEWACANNRTVQWMLGNMDPLRSGWHHIDGITAWPSDYLASLNAGQDAEAIIKALRGGAQNTPEQLRAIFIAMDGAWWKPGAVFFKRWHLGGSIALIAGVSSVVGQVEDFGFGQVPGPWYYLSAAYRWGAWFAGLDFTTVVNSATYFYVSNYLPMVITHYSQLGVGIGAPGAVTAIASQMSRAFTAGQAVSRGLGGTATFGQVVSAVSAIAVATGVGAVLSAALAVLQLTLGVVAQNLDAQRNSDNMLPIYSPLIRSPRDPNCNVDVSTGTTALADREVHEVAPAATAMIQSFMAAAAARQRAAVIPAQHAPPMPMSTGTKVLLGGLGVVALGALVLALRKR